MDYKHGGDIYTYAGMLDFSSNINPFGPGESVLDAARLAIDSIGVYPDSSCRRLRTALAEKLDIDGEFLIFGNGAADLIFSLVVSEKPKKALLAAPSFAEYSQALKAVDCKISYYYLKEEQNFCIGWDYLECLTGDVDMIFLCAPDNPSGSVIEKELLHRIAETCERLNIRMVLDECFYEFLEDSTSVLSKQDVLRYPHLVILRAFTKMYAIPGLRLGYGMTADLEFLERMRETRQPWSVSAPAQAAGIAALKDSQRVEKTRGFICEERKMMEKEFERIGVRYFPSSANYMLIKSHYDLFSRLKEMQILIRDCSNYEGLSKGYYRAAIKRREENQILIQALEKIYGEG